MDGSERIDVVAGATEEVVTYNIQPQVIVERVQDGLAPEEIIEEEELVTEEPEAEEEVVPEQNGAAEEEEAPAAVPVTTTTTTTVDDIIADAVASEIAEEQPVTETSVDNGTPVDGEAEAAEGVATEEPAPVEEQKKEPELDLEQCRCCTSKEDLQDIFAALPRDSNLLISALIIKLCSNVNITKRDHLPHLICKACVYKVEIAWEFKESCEKTDRELRKHLSRSKNKIRKRTDYTLLDYASSEDDGDQIADDDEFKLSDELEEEVDSGSDFSLSDTEKKPKRRGRPARKTTTPTVATPPSSGKRGRGRPRKDQTPTTKAKSAPVKRASIVYVEANGDSSDDSDDGSSDDALARPSPAKTPKKTCAKCKMPLTRGIHKCATTSAGKSDYSCPFCAEKFGSQSLYMNHQQLHTNFVAANSCIRCHRRYVSKFELRKHQTGPRCQRASNNNCLSCNRVMANPSQLAVHLRSKCSAAKPGAAKPGATTTVKRENVSPKKEKNLFKFVAPPTSTYWSDSGSD